MVKYLKCLKSCLTRAYWMCFIIVKVVSFRGTYCLKKKLLGNKVIN